MASTVKKKVVKKAVKKVVKKAEPAVQQPEKEKGKDTAEEEVITEELKAEAEALAEEAKKASKKKPGLFSKGSPTPIYKLPIVEDKKAILYGKDKVEAFKKELEGKCEILEEYPVKEPFSYTIIAVDLKTRDIIYFAIEPELLGKEKEIYDFIVSTFTKIITYNQKVVASPEVLSSYLKRKIEELLEDMGIALPPGGKERIIYFLLRDYIGYGKLQILMDDTNLEDLSCDGTNVPIFVYHRKYEQIKTNIHFPTALELDSYVVTLAQRCGKHISVAEPILDTTMPDGSRINMTYSSEITTRGSTISIRKFNADPLSITHLIKYGTLTPIMGAHLWLAVQYQDSMLFVGGSASGKTASLIATAMFIPWESKIISIEDTREINIPQENWLPGVTRESFGGGKSVSMYDLLRAALRQRPEYLLVGEVRGQETMTMFQAMATGHTTYSTMHGESAQDVIHRLENKPINVPRVLLEALNLMIVHTNAKIKGKRVRRIKEMREITGYEPSTNDINSSVVFEWDPRTDSFKEDLNSRLVEKVAERENLEEEDVKREIKRRAKVLEWMVEKDISYYKDVTRIVQDYYSDKTHMFSDDNKVYKAIKEGRGLELIGAENH